MEYLRILTTCEVCGQEAHPKFIREWNDRDVCVYCLNEIHDSYIEIKEDLYANQFDDYC